MWSRLEDELFDHRKMVVAGDAIGGPHGMAIALGFYTAAVLWSNKHLTDGMLPWRSIRRWPHTNRHEALANAMVAAGLWDQAVGGYAIHDWADYNLPADAVKARRQHDRERKRAERARQETPTNGRP